jgi:hypothetical protein
MTRRTSLWWLTLGLLPVLAAAKTPSKPTNFSGRWVLDFNQTKNPPIGLESYSLAVNQDEQQLKVETSVKGNLQPSGGGSQYPPRGGGYPRGMGMPGPVWPSGGRRIPSGQGQAQRLEAAALKVYPPTAVYKLDGTPSTAQLGDRDRSDATAKAEWAKGGKQLKLTLLGEGAEKSGQAHLKDDWRLDGQYLKIDRNIHTPNGSTTVHLVFRKESPDSTSAAAQAHPGGS